MASRASQAGGYLVPKGTMLVVGRMAVQNDPALWEDPLRFDPERFSPENFKALDRWQYLPFGGGPRPAPPTTSLCFRSRSRWAYR